MKPKTTARQRRRERRAFITRRYELKPVRGVERFCEDLARAKLDADFLMDNNSGLLGLFLADWKINIEPADRLDSIRMIRRSLTPLRAFDVSNEDPCTITYDQYEIEFLQFAQAFSVETPLRWVGWVEQQVWSRGFEPFVRAPKKKKARHPRELRRSFPDGLKNRTIAQARATERARSWWSVKASVHWFIAIDLKMRSVYVRIPRAFIHGDGQWLLPHAVLAAFEHLGVKIKDIPKIMASHLDLIRAQRYSFDSQADVIGKCRADAYRQVIDDALRAKKPDHRRG